MLTALGSVGFGLIGFEGTLDAAATRTFHADLIDGTYNGCALHASARICIR